MERHAPDSYPSWDLRHVRPDAPTSSVPSRVRAARRAIGVDRAALLGYAVLTAVFLPITTLTPHHLWAEIALPSYFLALGISLLGHSRRFAPWVAATGSVLLPLIVLVSRNLRQPEVDVIVSGARRLVETGSPYISSPTTLAEYAPYLPALFFFGLPSRLGALGRLADPRVGMDLLLLAVLARAVTAKAAGNGSTQTAATVGKLLLLFSFPVIALTMSVSAIDIPICAMALLALMEADRDRCSTAGLASGIALAMKPTAVCLVFVVAVMIANRFGRDAYIKSSASTLAAAALFIVPVLVVEPRGLWTNVIAFPAGTTSVESPARSPLPGVVLSQALPWGTGVALVVLMLAGVVMAAYTVHARPATLFEAARLLSLGLVLAFALAPNSRFGYFVLPCLVWGIGHIVWKGRGPELTAGRA
jgi:hypothetical protein